MCLKIKQDNNVFKDKKVAMCLKIKQGSNVFKDKTR